MLIRIIFKLKLADVEAIAAVPGVDVIHVGSNDLLVNMGKPGQFDDPEIVAAIDAALIPKHTILFIKETVGLILPDGSQHDGYWYASDIGGDVKGKTIDLFTGWGQKSMSPFRGMNLSSLSVTKAGEFKGCPPA